ncbi:MAG: GGDEF domain-containing protein [Oscillospiraceae bacterium]|nr:GGDEF domain-containing protein [Oscillospiraceae bacterium]
MFNGRKIIAVCIPKAFNIHSFEYLCELNKCAVEKGFSLFVYQPNTDLALGDRNDAGERFIFDLMDFDKIDGVVIFSEILKDNKIADIIAEKSRKNNKPVIAVERYVEGCINVKYDYKDCFEKIVRHIIVDHKLTKVNFIAGIEGNDFSEERLNVYKKVLEEQGIPYDPERVGYGNFWEGPTKEVMEKFLADGKELPEAIICSNDTMAMTACKCLYEKGYSVPDDVLISGFDGIDEERYHTPRLTTCRSSKSEMSRLIVDTIDNYIKGNEVRKESIVSFEMVISQSCGCVARKAIDATTILSDMQTRLNWYQTCSLSMTGLLATISSKRNPQLIIDSMHGNQVFYNVYCCLNTDALNPKSGVVGNSSDKPFTDEMLMVYRGNWVEPSQRVVRFERKDIAPEYEKYIDMNSPLVFSCIHYLDVPLGYLCINYSLDLSAYERIPQITEAFGTGFGNVRMYTAMERLYTHDTLTELYNRRGFYQLVAPRFENAMNNPEAVMAIVSADLDGLKYINDNFGHSEGDNAIKVVAMALEYAAVEGEICSRFGGDEFVVAGLVQNGDTYADEFKARVDEYIERYNSVSGRPYKVETSIGIVCYNPRGTTIDEMIKMSDNLMYADKANHKEVRSRARYD